MIVANLMKMDVAGGESEYRKGLLGFGRQYFSQAILQKVINAISQKYFLVTEY